MIHSISRPHRYLAVAIECLDAAVVVHNAVDLILCFSKGRMKREKSDHAQLVIGGGLII